MLGHVRAAWDHAHPDARFVEQDVVVTCPASFDEAARELTVAGRRSKAGLAAGGAARGAAGGVLRVGRHRRRRRGRWRPAIACWCSTSAAAPPTSR
jgi:hypothetical protein